MIGHRLPTVADAYEITVLFDKEIIKRNAHRQFFREFELYVEVGTSNNWL